MSAQSAMPTATQRQTSRSQAGFTLLELMVTVLIGSIVIMGIYAMYDSSIRGYRLQGQTVDALGSLRLASQQIRKELRSVGYNAPANSSEEPWVSTTTTSPLVAVTIEEDPDFTVPLSAQNQNIDPIRMRLLGDFSSHRVYRTLQIDNAGQRVRLDWTADDGNEATFDRLFSEQNLLRVETQGAARQEQYFAITGSDWSGGIAPIVEIDGSVANLVGFGTGYEISVANYIQYRLRVDPNDTLGVKTDLVRERLESDGVTVIDNSTLTIAEYVIDFQIYDFCINSTGIDLAGMTQVPVTRECFDTLATFEGAGWSLGATDANSSTRLRSLNVKLSVRSTYEDEGVVFVARTGQDLPLRSFELDDSLRGAARVYETGFSTFLTSIQARRL